MQSALCKNDCYSLNLKPGSRNRLSCQSPKLTDGFEKSSKCCDSETTMATKAISASTSETAEQLQDIDLLNPDYQNQIWKLLDEHHDLQVSMCFFYRDFIEIVLDHESPTNLPNNNFKSQLSGLLKIPEQKIHVSKLSASDEFILTEVSNVLPSPGNRLVNTFEGKKYGSSLGLYVRIKNHDRLRALMTGHKKSEGSRLYLNETSEEFGEVEMVITEGDKWTPCCDVSVVHVTRDFCSDDVNRIRSYRRGLQGNEVEEMRLSNQVDDIQDYIRSCGKVRKFSCNYENNGISVGEVGPAVRARCMPGNYAASCITVLPCPTTNSALSVSPEQNLVAEGISVQVTAQPFYDELAESNAFHGEGDSGLLIVSAEPKDDGLYRPVALLVALLKTTINGVPRNISIAVSLKHILQRVAESRSKYADIQIVTPTSICDFERLPYELVEMIVLKTAFIQHHKYWQHTRQVRMLKSVLKELLKISFLWWKCISSNRAGRALKRYLNGLSKPYPRKQKKRYYLSRERRLSLERNPITGLALLAGKLFVTTLDSSDIKIYDTKTDDFQESITVKGLTCPWDLAACSVYKRLYVIDSSVDAILAIPIHLSLDYSAENVSDILFGDSMWLTKHETANFRGLSVSKVDRSIVAVSWGYTTDTVPKIVIINASTKVLTQIPLPENIYPHQSFRLSCSEEQYIVCHGLTNYSRHQIQIFRVKQDGQTEIVRSFGDERAVHRRQKAAEGEGVSKKQKVDRQSSISDEGVFDGDKLRGDKHDTTLELERLDSPYSIGLGRDGCCFVADYGQNRILMLDKELRLQRVVRLKINLPRQLLVDDIASKLYVGQDDGEISVFPWEPDPDMFSSR